MGKIHLQQLVSLEDIQLRGFFEPDDLRAKEIQSEFRIPRFSDPESLMDQVDAVDIVAPTIQHFLLCELALRKGKHVFVEKPMTHTLEEAKLLHKLVEEAQIKFQVGHVERFNPAFLALENYTLNPMFIEVHRLAEFNPRGTDVSVILDLMIHDIDIVLSLVRDPINRISATGVAVISQSPDIANVRIEFHNGCVANLTSSRISLKKMRKMRLFQKDAYISIDFLEKRTEVIQLTEQSQGDGSINVDIEWEGRKKNMAIHHPPVKPTNAIRMELEFFRDCIRYNRPVLVGVQDGYQSIEVAHQIIQKINHKMAGRETSQVPEVG